MKLTLTFGRLDEAHIGPPRRRRDNPGARRNEALMAFELPDSWVWDFWVADDGEHYHLFFLYASRALGDPELRHHRASIGHAVSADLRSWRRVADALVRSDPPAFDDLATWTGSVVRHPDGRWLMFYTGSSLNTDGVNVQTIGCASSVDLMTWTKFPGPVLRADPRWYEVYAQDGNWHDEAFRDPWVFADPAGNGWHMLITARSAHGPSSAPQDTIDRGVVGHAWSADLEHWELREPLSAPGSGFGQLEVLHVAEVEGRQVLIFNCLTQDMSPAHRAGTPGGIWAVPIDSATGPYDVATAHLVADPRLYVGKVIANRATGSSEFLAFRHIEDGEFVGALADPQRVGWRGDRLVIHESAPAAVEPPSDISNGTFLSRESGDPHASGAG
jgi:beta-fructofuranosidase